MDVPERDIADSSLGHWVVHFEPMKSKPISTDKNQLDTATLFAKE
jgi:hypothetical protein